VFALSMALASGICHFVPYCLLILSLPSWSSTDSRCTQQQQTAFFIFLYKEMNERSD